MRYSVIFFDYPSHTALFNEATASVQIFDFYIDSDP